MYESDWVKRLASSKSAGGEKGAWDWLVFLLIFSLEEMQNKRIFQNALASLGWS